MIGHVMRVAYDPMWEAVLLTVECREPNDAACRSGSEACNAADWLVDDVERQCTSQVSFPMHDGMPITVQRDSKGWTWGVIEASVVS